MRTLLLLFTLQTLPVLAQWEWLQAVQSSSAEPEWGHAVRYCPDGGMVATGQWRNLGQFGATVFNGPLLNQMNAFVVRYAPDGEVEWAHSFRSTEQLSNTDAYGLAVDADGNIIVGGTVGDTLVIDEVPVLLVGVGGISSWFIAKFDPDGTLLWVTSHTGSAPGRFLWCLDVDEAGDIWAGGTRQSAVSRLVKFSGADGTEEFVSDDIHGSASRVEATGNGKILLHGQASNNFTFGGMNCTLSGAMGGGGYTNWTIQLDTAGTADWYYAPDQGYTGGMGWSTMSMSATADGHSFVYARANTRINGDTIAYGGNRKGLFLLDPSGVPVWWKHINDSGTLTVFDMRTVEGGGCWVVGDMSGTCDLLDTTVTHTGLFAFLYNDAGDVARRVFGPQVVNTWSVDARPDEVVVAGTQAGNTSFGDHVITDNWFGFFAARYGPASDVGIDEFAAPTGLSVYPNPANDLLNIVADASLFGQRAVIEVFDATGSRVHAEQVNTFNALQTLDLSRDWKEGLYLVMVRVEGQAPKAARVVVKR
ncbi:MAG: T9SS type A sorting domain-containing protein [Flavobacteriales bacterium]|nr:MAG: T9SS type A sorting domain-containing protein [Flavobacteriales bacterium]